MRRSFFIVFIGLLMMGVGCRFVSKPMNTPTEHVLLVTSDNIEIAAQYRTNDDQKAAILLHMMPATKESWDAFARELDHAGYASIAIDERGHGESTMHGTLDYQKFTEQQQQEKILDVQAAFDYLVAEGFDQKNIVVIGASIGGNLAIQFLSEHARVPFAIALSPGLNYRGVKTDGFIKQLHENQHVVLVASDDDDRDAAASIQTLHQLNPSQTSLVEKKNIGHGTTMFEKDSTLMQELIQKLP